MSAIEETKARVKNAIGAIPDFPKPGILFRDIFPLFRDPSILNDLIDLLVHHVKQAFQQVDVVVGLEARGFLFGPMLALRLGCGFAPIRKKGKLPGECIQVSYTLEYGTDVFEMQKGAVKAGQKVLIVDDLIATGGTMHAACQLVRSMEAEVLECLVIIELIDLKGKEKLTAPFHTLIDFEGE
ncbi:adenine phosphoribosyltransferase-like [Lytechinus variegatus]|uniref:adenine phosphoribosyltransferase-like n=1 Tax=Lytechinus variegatus TaxID=7654 RepID=UPI001BB150A4|nr:adenine phosphoribosyltransferase-like [Lytechinus variegatus]